MEVRGIEIIRNSLTQCYGIKDCREIKGNRKSIVTEYNGIIAPLG